MVSKPNILLFMTDHQRADVIGMRQCGRGNAESQQARPHGISV